MLLRDRRVAGARRPLPSYLRPLLCLIAVLLHDPAPAAAARLSSIGTRRGRPAAAAVGSGGGGVGVAAARPWGIPSKVWTAALAAAAVRDEGSGRLVPTAAASAHPQREARTRERARRFLLSVRGGSEGLRSEKWSREKAAAGEERARRGRRACGEVGEDQVGDEGVRFAQGSSRSAAGGRRMAVDGGGGAASRPADIASEAEEFGSAHTDRATTSEIGIGLREGEVEGVETTASVEERLGRSGQGGEPPSGAADRLEPQDDQDGDGRRGRLGGGSTGAGEEENQHKKEEKGDGEREKEKEENGRRHLLNVHSEESAASGDVTGSAGVGPGAATSGPAGTESIDDRGGIGQEEPVPRRRPTAARGDPRPGTRATGWSLSKAATKPSGVDGGGGGFHSSAAGASSGDATATAGVRRRRGVTATTTSGGWMRKPTPQQTAAADGAGTAAHAEHLPRAGAPPPPRGEVNVWRPWARHGAAAPPSAARVGSGGDGAVQAMSVVGVAGAGSESAVVAEGEGGGGAAPDASAASPGAVTGAGKGKVRRMRWEPKYLTVKAVFFLFYSSLGAIMPYLPVYYHSLGIPDRRIGHLGAITPAMTFIFTPLWGALTDKSGMLKQILVLTFTASTLLRVCLPYGVSFLWIISIITLTAIINAPVRPLLDSSALQSLDDRGEYGKQRLWGQWGFGIGSFVTGKLLAKNFKAAFYMHAAFSVPTLLILLRFSPKKEDRGKEPPKFAELYRLVVHDVDVLVFFSMVFAIGLSSGVIENFAYKRLRELGGTGSVLGVSRLISSLSGIPMFFFSGAIVKRFSIVGILTASMMSFIARFVIYACIKNPWAGLPAEALRGVTFAGFWAASTCHVGAIAPPGLSTTMLGLLNATYGGIGQSLGSLIGGSLSNSFGTARAFLVYAGVDTCLLLAFFLFWGLHPNGQQKDRGSGGGIGSSSGGGAGGDAAEKASVAAVRTPSPAATATAAAAVPPAAPLQDQTFSPPTPPPEVAPR